MKKALLFSSTIALLSACASPMDRAIARGRADEVLALLDQGYDINAREGSKETTPLKSAVIHGRVNVAKALLDRGADPNIRHNGTSALSLAAINGDEPMVELLLSRGAQAEERDVSWARVRGDRAVIEKLSAAVLAQKTREKSRETARVQASTEVASGVDLPSYRLAPHAEDFALVVGIEKYLDAPEARFAESDAKAMRAHLEALGVPARNIIVLTGDQAGRAGLERYLERWLPDNVTVNSRVFFYFAGDGAAPPQGGPAYLLPYNGDSRQLEATGYPLARLFEKLTALKARQALAIADAGFAGGERSATVPVSLASTKVDMEVAAMGDVVLLAAAPEAAGAPVVEPEKHGALTYFALKGLNGPGAGDSGFVTIKSLSAYVARSAKEAGLAAPRLYSGPLGEGDLRLR